MLSQLASRHQKTQLSPSGKPFPSLCWRAKELTFCCLGFFIQRFFAHTGQKKDNLCRLPAKSKTTCAPQLTPKPGASDKQAFCEDAAHYGPNESRPLKGRLIIASRFRQPKHINAGLLGCDTIMNVLCDSPSQNHGVVLRLYSGFPTKQITKKV